MISHEELGNTPFSRSRKLREMIALGLINFAGYSIKKIYGGLTCKSGKKMKLQNRVFFTSEEDAIKNGFRPCGKCMRKGYLLWKTGADKLLHK